MTIAEIADAFLSKLHATGTAFDPKSFFDDINTSPADRAAVQRFLYQDDLVSGTVTSSWAEHDYYIINPAITMKGVTYLERKSRQDTPSVNIGSVSNSQIAIGDHNHQVMTNNDLAALQELAEALGAIDMSHLDPHDVELVQINVETLNLAAAGEPVEPGRVRAALLGLRSTVGQLAVGTTGGVLANLIDPLLGVIL